MKSELTLHLDEDLKERAERLAEQRGTTVSKIVEQHFRALLHEETDRSEESHTASADSEAQTDPLNTVPSDLPARTQRMIDEIGPTSESLDLDEDTQAWIDAAHEKHK